MKKLEGLSIEQLEERNEFTAVTAEHDGGVGTDPLKCSVCQC